MKKVAVLLAAMLLGVPIGGCSGGDRESNDGKSVTRKVSGAAVKEMRTPLQKARDVRRRAEKRLDEIQKNVKE